MNRSRSHSHYHLPSLTPFSSLSVHRLLAGTGDQFLLLFGSIFLFQILGNDLFLYFLVAVLALFIRIPILPAIVPLLSRMGLRSSMFVGLFLQLSRTVLLGLIAFSPSLQNAFFVFLTLALGSLFNCFYWSPFHDEFTLTTKRGHRGSALSAIFVIQMIINTFVPVVSGYLANDLGYLSLFLFASFFVLTSFIPLLGVRNTKPHYSYSFLQTFQNLFRKKYRRVSLSLIGEGFESSVLFFVWPVFIYEVLSENLVDVGLFAGALIAFQVVIQLLVGRSVDHGNAKSVSVMSSFWDSASWVVRAFFISPLGVFISTTAHSFTHTVFRTSIHAIFYDARADGGFYKNELTIVRELGLNIGRVLFLVLALPLSFLIPIQYFFLFAALGVLANVFWRDLLR